MVEQILNFNYLNDVLSPWVSRWVETSADGPNWGRLEKLIRIVDIGQPDRRYENEPSNMLLIGYVSRASLLNVGEKLVIVGACAMTWRSLPNCFNFFDKVLKI